MQLHRLHRLPRLLWRVVFLHRVDQFPRISSLLYAEGTVSVVIKALSHPIRMAHF